MINSSIVNNNFFARDSNEPFTFLQWLVQSTSSNSDVNIQFANYKKYILRWTEKKSLSKKESSKTLQSAYVQVLREITLTYSTEEEKRFITNADLTNPSDIEVILPFFINRLKQICLYYSIAREKLKYTSIEYSQRGTSVSIEKAVKDLIFSTARLDLSFDNLPTFFPPISAIAQDLSIYIEEVYDTTSNYFNQTAPEKNTNKTALQNISSTNIIFDTLYIDFKQAIIDAINYYPFYLDSIMGLFSVNIALSGTELNYLKNRDFIDYINTGLSQDLKINLLKKLAPKFLANDFYFLSTGNSVANTVSGVLFSVTPLSGAPTLNLLNRNSPTVATVPSVDNLYTAYEIGKFFLPQHQGILVYATPQKKFYINKEKLQPNTVYTFPDPETIGNVVYNNSTEKEAITPLTYIVDVTWNKTSRSNQYKFGDVFATPYNSFYYGYQSREQDLNQSASGISRVQDNIDFWDGQESNIWKNEDTWPGIDMLDSYPYEKRQDSLLINTGTPVCWSSDIFNNDFCLIKEIDSLKPASKELTSDGVMPGQSTILSEQTNYLNEKSIYEKHTEPGVLYFRDNIKGIIQSGYEALSSVILRYHPSIVSDIRSKVYYFAIYGNTFVLETSGHVIVDSFEYNYDRLAIESITPQGLIFNKFNNSSKLQKFVGEWYSEKNNLLYLCFLRIRNESASSNYKVVYPVIHAATLSPLQSRIIYPNKETDLVRIYSLSGTSLQPPQVNLVNIDGASFEFLNKTNIFNITYFSKNLNSMPFVVNEQIFKNEPYCTTYNPQFFQPFYFIVDNNYYTPSLPYFVKYVGASTGLIGSHLINSGRFNTLAFNLSNMNYAYCDGIKPLQLNSLASYIVQFDWQTYSEITMFIGCSSYIVRKIDDYLLWNAYTSKAGYLFKDTTISSYQEKISSNSLTIPITSYITRLTDDASLVRFDIVSNHPTFKTPVCDNPDDIYRRITITKAGPGKGQVLSDPFCIDCSEKGNKCFEDFGINTTVSFIASADYFSYFEKWEGGVCNGINTDCIFPVTTAVNLTAYFGKIPTVDLLLITPAGSVFSQDGRIRVTAGNGSTGPATANIAYPINTIITLSAVYPISGWAMYGYDGGRCKGVQGLRCTFGINTDMTIEARYVRFYEYPLRINLTSYIAAQSAKGDSVAIGVDNVDDGVRSGNEFFYNYLCNNASCTYILTGTNTERYKNQIATLCARPSPGRKLKYWIGELECNQSEFTNVILSETSADILNTGYICKLEMNTYKETTAVFDKGYYTLTVVTTGDGIGSVFSESPDPYFKREIEGDQQPEDDDGSFDPASVTNNIVKFAVLSGTTLTVKASAFRGNSFIWLSSYNCTTLSDAITSCQMTLNQDRTILIKLSAFAYWDVVIINKATGGVRVSAFPAGRYNTLIACPSSPSGGCRASYKSGRIVSLVAENYQPANPTAPVGSVIPLTGVQYFQSNKLLGGGGLKYQYTAGPGIYLSVMDRPEPEGEIFSIIDGSIILTSGGIPYVAGPGIIVEAKAFLQVTDTAYVTAWPL